MDFSLVKFFWLSSMPAVYTYYMPYITIIVATTHSFAFPQLCEAMDIGSLESVAVYECISSEGATANPLKVNEAMVIKKKIVIPYPPLY